MSSIILQLEKLLQYPKEDLDKEYKNWLDLSSNDGRADLAKALIAIANHGGGYVIIGYEDENGNLIPAEGRPENLNGYSQEIINGILHRYADPVFHCECREIINPETELSFPIISVPSGHIVPIRTRRTGPNGRYFEQNQYLIRRPGPRSETPQSAQEWDALINRCIMNRRADLLGNIRRIFEGTTTQTIENNIEEELNQWIADSLIQFGESTTQKFPNEIPSRYSHGKWYVGYLIGGEFEAPTLGQFREIIRAVQGTETGWPVWVTLRTHSVPYPINRTIECHIVPRTANDGSHSDFWKGSPDGKMFLLRGYQEDYSATRYPPGTVLDFILPIWRISECVLHSARLANRLLDEPTDITLSANWDGLENRTLVSWASPRYPFFHGEYRCHTNFISSKITYNSNLIEDNLVEIISEVLHPLYEAFDFFSLPRNTLINELRRLRNQVQ